MTDDRTTAGEPPVVEWRLAAIAVAGAVAVALAGARPTGRALVDVVLVGLASAAVVWSAATAPWWVPTLAAGAAAAVSLDATVATIGVAGFVLGLLEGTSRRGMPELRAVVAAIALNVLARSALGGFLGLSTILTVTVGAVVLIMGLVGRTPSRRRLVRWVLVGVGAVALVCLGSAALTVFGIRPTS
jgi:hypothetical protein